MPNYASSHFPLLTPSARAFPLGVYDGDAGAYVARMTTAPTAEQKSVYSWFVDQLKTSGVWPYITDCGFLCTHDAQSSRLGIKNAINLSPVGGGPSQVPGYGVIGNGTSQALDTGYKFPAGNQNNASLSIYVADSGQSDNADIGNTNSVVISRGTSDTSISSTNGASTGTVATTDSVGFYVANRTGPLTTDGKLWKRGQSVVTSQGASATPDAAFSIWVGGQNQATPQYSGKMLMFWHIGTGMPDAIIATLSNLVERACAMLSASTTAIATLTKKTKSLYRYMIEMTRQNNWLFAAFDNTYWPLGQTPNLISDIATMTGKVPSIIANEWVDPLCTNGTGAADSAAQLARIKAHYAAGGITTMHHHPGNPVTGSFEQVAGGAGTAGTQYDMSGSAVPACLSGGSKRTQFFAYVDRIIAFMNSCVDPYGEPIPLIWRPWHEMNGTFFWWTDSTLQSNTVQLWKDFVDRVRNAGVQNVLFDWNVNYSPNTGTSTFFAGVNYVDFLSQDFYDTGNPAAGMSVAVAGFNLLQTASIRRPEHFAEVGWNNAAGVDATLWSAKVGGYHRDRLAKSSYFLPWRNPYAPKVGDATASDFSAMVADASTISRDRLPAIYAKTEAL